MHFLVLNVVSTIRKAAPNGSVLDLYAIRRRADTVRDLYAIGCLSLCPTGASYIPSRSLHQATSSLKYTTYWPQRPLSILCLALFCQLT